MTHVVRTSADAAGPAEVGESAPPRSLLYHAVNAAIGRLERGNGDRRDVATLAALRRADPTDVLADPAVWEITLADLPAGLRSDGDDPSRSERAIYAALVLYALHQSPSGRSMHVAGKRGRLGSAVRDLGFARSQDNKLDAAVQRRFHVMATAATFEQTIYHLRQLVSQLKSADIPLDYGALADDLLQLQLRAGGPKLVRSRWGRQLHAIPRVDAAPSPENGDPS